MQKLLYFEDVSISVTANSGVSPFSAYGGYIFDKGVIKTLFVIGTSSIYIGFAYMGSASGQNGINVVANKAGTYVVRVGYIPN